MYCTNINWKKISRPPFMPDWSNWLPGLLKLATISLFLTDSNWLVGDACIWISRGWQACRLCIRGRLIWALLCCHLIFLDKKLPLSSHFFDLCLLMGYCREQSCGGLHIASHPSGGLNSPCASCSWMKIISCRVSTLACFKYLYIVMECWVKNW